MPGKSKHKSAERNTQRAKNAWNFFYCGSQAPYGHVSKRIKTYQKRSGHNEWTQRMTTSL